MVAEGSRLSPLLPGERVLDEKALRDPVGTAALLQAQRDYFGAHTFERVDREGHFHRSWF